MQTVVKTAYELYTKTKEKREFQEELTLLKEKGAKIIFADCGNLNQRDIDKINRINGIYLNGEFASITKRMARKCKRRSLYLFVFSESESENIYKLSVLRKVFEGINTEVHIRIYV